jgi:hypothetical protein
VHERLPGAAGPGTARDGGLAGKWWSAIPGRRWCRPRPSAQTAWEPKMLKVALWIVVVIFIIGLLVVFGVLDFIF